MLHNIFSTNYQKTNINFGSSDWFAMIVCKWFCDNQFKITFWNKDKSCTFLAEETRTAKCAWISQARFTTIITWKTWCTFSLTGTAC